MDSAVSPAAANFIIAGTEVLLALKIASEVMGLGLALHDLMLVATLYSMDG